MTDWKALRCAYGSAERVPDLLARADASGVDSGAEWDALWGHLCHQGTVYPASYAAIPALTAMCLRQETRGYMASLHLVASILASDDAPKGAELLRAQYADEVRQLRDVAERCLERAKDDIEFIYGLETLVTFEDRGVWSRNLSCLADGEVELECVGCDEHLLVDVEELPATVARWGSSAKPTTVKPAQHVESVEARLTSLAIENSRPGVAAKLPFMFGVVVCPECGTQFSISRALR